MFGQLVKAILATSAQLIMLEGETLKTRGMQLSVMMTV
jgi:hypothetical protein